MSNAQTKKIEEAAEALKRIQEEIAPFTKPMKMGYPPSAERWRFDSGDIEIGVPRDIFLNTLKKVTHPK